MIVPKLLAATVAGAAFGAGALALTPSDAATTSSSSTSTAHPDRSAIARHRNVIHATWTTRDGVHHEAIRGTVKVVTTRSITVRASDGVVETYSVSSATKVRVRRDGQKALESIKDVKVGDRALVVGAGAHHATHVIAVQPKPASTSGSGA